MSSSNAFQPRIEFNLKRRMSKWKVEQQQCSGRCFLLGLIPSNPCFHLHKAATVEQGRETQLILISEILQARQHRDCGNTHRMDCFFVATYIRWTVFPYKDDVVAFVSRLSMDERNLNFAMGLFTYYVSRRRGGG